jgi:hypothetical protein
MKKIFSVLLLGTALTFSTACKKDEKKADDKAKPADDKATKPADDKAKPADDTAAKAPLPTTGDPTCDELIKKTMCSYDKMGDAVPASAREAFMTGIKGWQDAIKNDATKQATIDSCKMSLDASKDAYAAQGC